MLRQEGSEETVGCYEKLRRTDGLLCPTYAYIYNAIKGN
jgi:hypothetical protein